jgi:hypothetical protein
VPADPHNLDALEAAAAEHGGVRVWSIIAPNQQQLAERIAIVLGEHMQDHDELHLTHAAVQNGHQDKHKRRFMRQPQTWTELSFEYSAVVVLRDLQND